MLLNSFWSGNLLYLLEIWLLWVLSAKLVLVGTLESMSTLQTAIFAFFGQKSSSAASGMRRNFSCQRRLSLPHRTSPPTHPNSSAYFFMRCPPLHLPGISLHLPFLLSGKNDWVGMEEKKWKISLTYNRTEKQSSVLYKVKINENT